MGLGDWLKGKGRSGAPPPPVRRPDDLVTAFDERGREIKIRRAESQRRVLELVDPLRHARAEGLAVTAATPTRFSLTV